MCERARRSRDSNSHYSIDTLLPELNSRSSNNNTCSSSFTCPRNNNVCNNSTMTQSSTKAILASTPGNCFQETTEITRLKKPSRNSGEGGIKSKLKKKCSNVKHNKTNNTMEEEDELLSLSPTPPLINRFDDYEPSHKLKKSHKSRHHHRHKSSRKHRKKSTSTKSDRIQASSDRFETSIKAKGMNGRKISLIINVSPPSTTTAPNCTTTSSSPTPSITPAMKQAMFDSFQPWVLSTYGDTAKTKTITMKKCERIIKTLRGQELNNADNSKFRFWVKNKGFTVSLPKSESKLYGPEGETNNNNIYNYNDDDDEEDFEDNKIQQVLKLKPDLFVPMMVKVEATGGVERHVFKRVAIVEHFFDIIYTVHTETEAKNGKHSGQKRTYKAITEKYAFLPREAVTKFLSQCVECQKHGSQPPQLQPQNDNSNASQQLVKLNNESAKELTIAPSTTTSVNNNIIVPKFKKSHLASKRRIKAKHSKTNANKLEKIKSNIILKRRFPVISDSLKKTLKLSAKPPADLKFCLPFTTTYLREQRQLLNRQSKLVQVDQPENQQMLAVQDAYEFLDELKEEAKNERKVIMSQMVDKETNVWEEDIKNELFIDKEDDDDEFEDEVESDEGHEVERMQMELEPINSQPFPPNARCDENGESTKVFAGDVINGNVYYNNDDKMVHSAFSSSSSSGLGTMPSLCSIPSLVALSAKLGESSSSLSSPSSSTKSFSPTGFSDVFSNSMRIINCSPTTTTTTTTNYEQTVDSLDKNNSYWSNNSDHHHFMNGNTRSSPLSSNYSPETSLVNTYVFGSSMSGLSKLVGAEGINQIVDYSWKSNGTNSIGTSMYKPNFSQHLTKPTTEEYGPTDLSMKSKSPLLSSSSNSTSPSSSLFTQHLELYELATLRELINGHRESAAFLLKSADEMEQFLIHRRQ